MTNMVSVDISPELLTRFSCFDRPDPPAADAWSEGFTGADYRQALRDVGRNPDDTLALYLHIPFCPGRCLYCGCNTTVTHNSQRIDGYLDALEREVEMVGDAIGAGRDVLQLHVAGGTPNYLNDAQLTRLVELVNDRFRILPETDASIECDPRRTSAGQLELLYALGFRRVTFGVQDLEPRVQRSIGRIQSIDLVRDVYWMAREVGFDSIGFDLIYGLPEQTPDSFQATLDAVIEMAPDRVACFGYSRGTSLAMHQHAIDIHRLPDDMGRQGLFEQAVKSFLGSGYVWVGLDTFVLDTDELAIAQDEGRLGRNCIGYTTMRADHTIGLGTGAAGDVHGHCVQNEPNLSAWEATIERGEFPIARGHLLNSTDRRRREAIGYLICNLELPLELAEGCLDEEYHRLAAYARDGLVDVEGDKLRITPTGRYLLRHLCTEHEAYFAWDRARWHFSRSL
ncbi:oxygen-independent coproporphyrinogen III oxidase [Thiorhodovibrio frisius]|uniref:Coproporphyrinogen-III oxidase n=1 Tax=Thiorhodovibrio frisius TaxID=631362 RepID=H8Z0X1_9GAMM|nr:oxygen-independent coproporphyrinogen III oxidase [Thiorhodovibrio frisius]EIC21353.1 oxygen-independent coproporphyrinogen III oxidase [Thiorhodovibrio frisius]WPL23938.1 Oxygen-independent coproporphyrinogen-III oxidase [Thiorhodovibrio frisius]